MQATVKKTDQKGIPKEKKDGTPTSSRKTPDDKTKKKTAVVSTPRNFITKSSTADIYGQNKNTAAVVKAPKKATNSSRPTTNVSPMKDQLKASPSSVSLSKKYPPQSKVDLKPSSSRRTAKELPFVNVTVNSPLVKKKIARDKTEKDLKTSLKTVAKEDPKEKGFKLIKKEESNSDRKRSKTRTLNDDEVKVLTPDAMNNSEEMMNLSRKLAANPKAFYVDLEDEKSKKSAAIANNSDEEVTYEDDFESYASDFDSYHSDGTDAAADSTSPGSDTSADDDRNRQKETKDDENMLDSGNFDLRDAQRPGNRTAPVAAATMDFIQEQDEVDKKTSLTDEGFQDMSSASAGTSLQNEPFFIDFSKSKGKRKKRRLFQRLEQRAKDLLNMITLHEMSYNLFEMKPIPYDLFMATFGRSNYAQAAVQTFDDGANAATQTDDIVTKNKWSQNPIEFTKYDICRDIEVNTKKRSKSEEDFVHKFSFLSIINDNSDVGDELVDTDYENNPLRVYFEQKDGVGSGDMLPYETYKRKLKDKTFNKDKLARFLNKIESRISNVLSKNAGGTETNGLLKSKIPFSIGYVTLPSKENEDDTKATKDNLETKKKISKVIFSKNKANLFITVYDKNEKGFAVGRCFMSLWDSSNRFQGPLRHLVAIDDVAAAQFVGNTIGIFVAALKDGSIHVWDLSEEATWRSDDDVEDKIVEVVTKERSQTEIDREWNLKNRNVGKEQLPLQEPLQASAYTSSGLAMMRNQGTGDVVGLEVEMDDVEEFRDDGIKIIGKVYSLTRFGTLSISNIVHEKSKLSVQDIGKAFNSKIKLEANQTLSLIDYIDIAFDNYNQEDAIPNNFNLNAAKKRLLARKQEKMAIRELSRPKSSGSAKFESDRRPASAASARRLGLPLRKEMSKSWENSIVCCDFKLMIFNNVRYSLIAKNCGEVLCCRRSVSGFKVDRLCVATDTSTVTRLDVSQHDLPYFLAATDSGTINLWSLLDARVLLTLDCRNAPQSPDITKCQGDSKGRYVSSVAVKSSHTPVTAKMSISSVHWSPSNPCNIIALTSTGNLTCFDLTTSDIYPKHSCDIAAVYCTTSGANMALLTAVGELQIHKMASDERMNENIDLFRKYLTLL